MLGWGLGYFGQPHILIKFMGIKKASELKKSKWVGMSWLLLSLIFSYYVGMLGKSFFANGVANDSFVFILMTKKRVVSLLCKLHFVWSDGSHYFHNEHSNFGTLI